MTAVTRAQFREGLPRRSPLLMVGATVGLGIVAHVLGGGPAPVDCLPLWGGTLLAVVGTLTAQRAMRGSPRMVFSASALLGLGQFGMHMALSTALIRHSHPAGDRSEDSEEVLSSFSCGLVAAHTAAAMLLVILLMGAHYSVALALRVLAALCRRVGLLVVSPSPDDHVVTSTRVIGFDPGATGQRWRYGSVHSRRGPPLLLTR